MSNPKFVFVDEDVKKVQSFDENWYSNDGETFFPSVTTYLGAYPKGKGLMNWLKKQGFDADKILKDAAEEGSKIHNMIERFLKGFKLDYREEECDFFEWRQFMKFIEFFKLMTPEVEAIEAVVVDESMKTGGTLDLVCQMLTGGKKKERWLIDHKNSNYTWYEQEIQLATYVKMWNKKFPKHRIKRAGILHLKSQSRTVNNGNPKILQSGKVSTVKPKIQGKGWEVKEIDIGRSPLAKYGREFKACQELWLSMPENKNARPKNFEYDVEISIELLNTQEEARAEAEKQELTDTLKQSIEKENGNTGGNN